MDVGENIDNIKSRRKVFILSIVMFYILNSVMHFLKISVIFASFLFFTEYLVTPLALAMFLLCYALQ